MYRRFLLPKGEESAGDSTASLKLFAFELLMHNMELLELHVQEKTGCINAETPSKLYLIFERVEEEATLGQR